MKYTKPALTVGQQADLLIKRGMAGDRNLMIARLSAVNYYRLSGYWFPFKRADDTFQPGTHFDVVWDRYVFDRRLRLLVMDAIERIEVAVRSLLAYHHSHEFGAFAYGVDPKSMPKLTAQKYNEFVQRMQYEKKQSKDEFVLHFAKKYGAEHSCLPAWMAIEIMSFGTVLTFFRGTKRKVKKPVANAFSIPDQVFETWMFTLNSIRNICAHHGRLWNRAIGLKPQLPTAAKYPDWHTPVPIRNDRVFGVLTICQYCLKTVAPQSKWRDRAAPFLAGSANVPASEMGVNPDWQKCPIWQ